MFQKIFMRSNSNEVNHYLFNNFVLRLKQIALLTQLYWSAIMHSIVLNIKIVFTISFFTFN